MVTPLSAAGAQIISLFLESVLYGTAALRFLMHFNNLNIY